MGRHRFSIAGMMALVLAVCIALATLRFASEPMAGAVLLLTLGALALAVLAVVYRQGEGRAFWLGSALFGWGYMALASAAWRDLGADPPELITSMILDQVYPYLLPTGTPQIVSARLADLMGGDIKSKAILAKLDQRISMSFANETPLEDVLKYIKAATQGPRDTGIPIYVDPVGLNEAEKTMTSPVTLDVEGLPLKTTLRLLLHQLGLTYTVQDGLLTITSESAAPDTASPFRRIGHCYWALLLAWCGGLAGTWLYTTRNKAPG